MGKGIQIDVAVFTFYDTKNTQPIYFERGK